MQTYLNEDQLVFLVNLSQCSFYDAWDLTNPSSRTLIEECPEFVSDAYLKFKFDIQDIEYFEITEQDIDEKHWNQKCLNEGSGLKEESTKERICQSESDRELCCLDYTSHSSSRFKIKSTR